MQLSAQQWVAVGAAAVLLLWPQLMTALERVSKPSAVGKPKPDGGGVGRPAIVSDVLDLQESARQLGYVKAAELLGLAAVLLIESNGEARR